MSKVQWLGGWFQDNNGKWVECPAGTKLVNGFCVPYTQPAQATQFVPDLQSPQAQPPQAAPVIDCAAQCAGKLGVEYLVCLTACAQQALPAQPPPPATQPPQQIPPTTPISPPPSCPAGQVLVNGQCVPNASSITKPAEDKGLPWGWIIGGVVVVGGLAWLAMKSGGMAANPSERRYQVRFLPYIGSPYAKGKTGRVEKELPTLEQARAFMRKLKEPSSLIEDAELLEYSKSGWAGWSRRTIDTWDDKTPNANPLNMAHRSEPFFDAYVEAALWSSTDESTPSGGEPLDKNYGPGDLTKDALRKMRRDTDAFYLKYADLIGDNEARAGHDFWLTRNRHGAGFWDGDWPEPAATVLTDAAHAFGEQNLYVSRKKIHVYQSNANANPKYDTDQGFFEVGEFVHEGRTYSSGGAAYDRQAGVLVGYPKKTETGYVLQQFDGTPITALRLVSKYKGGFGRGTMYSWSAQYEGETFSGRNGGFFGGEGALLRMRAKSRR